MELLTRLPPIICVLFLFLISVHGRRKYPEKVHAMVQERLARRRWGSDVGAWSSWGAWSECSLTCGGGVSTQTRHCLARPKNSGKRYRRRRRQQVLTTSRCVGVYKRFHMCNQQECADPKSDLRKEQCAEYNRQPYLGKTYRWLPHYSSSRPCALTCRPEGHAFYVTFRHRVLDGTRCNRDGGVDLEKHVCAAGLCKVIGCDGVLGSGRVLDACGVCGGNNSTCQIISGLFTEPYLEAGYRQVVQIPTGACSIRVQELAPTKNYLALRDSKGAFIINGDWNIDLSGAYDGAGTSFSYVREDATGGETIRADGPITEPVDIFLLYRQMNRGIKYEYAIKRNDSLVSVLPKLPGSISAAAQQRSPPPAADNLLSQSAASTADLRPGDDARSAPSTGSGYVTSLYQSSPPDGRPGRGALGGAPEVKRRQHRRRRRRRRRFHWVVTGYTECSRSCGGGTRSSEVVCMKRKRKQLAADRRCDPSKRPRPQVVPCNTDPCPASWEPNAWSECSATCGRGHQTRTFLCTRSGQPVLASECTGAPSLPNTRPCHLAACGAAQPQAAAARWQVSQWSQCSVTCGWGTRARQVTCAGSTEGRCSEEARPRDTAPCRRQDCPEVVQNDRAAAAWIYTQWTEQCSVECGEGVQSRLVVCGGGNDTCDVSQRPEQSRPCKTDRGCGGVWFTGPWSKCSRECGAGLKTRSVLCVRYSGGRYSVVPEAACGSARPGGRQPCRGTGLCTGRWFFSDWSACSRTCGPGIQLRTVSCLSPAGTQSADCPSADPPVQRRSCLLTSCPKPVAPLQEVHDNEIQAHPTVPGPSSDDPEQRELSRPSTDGAEVAQPDLTNSIAFDAEESAGNDIELFDTSEGAEAGTTVPSEFVTAAETSAGDGGNQQSTAGPRQRGRTIDMGEELPGERHGTETCTDRFSNCNLVQQARLCKYKYYKNVCCATCRS